MSEDIRWLQRFDSYQKALATLERIVSLSEERLLSEPEMLGLIQAFELTHELAWKLFKDYFQAKGFQDISGSRDATRLAFSENLVENGDVWMNMIVSRNLSSHTYDSATAEKIAGLILDSYIDEFRTLRTKLADKTE
ncbi:MAG: nucleotidyltransferase substrate binding protein [Planctomycetaceae bacterium]|jgi:nucleotidyltransferase substrate binding protein (TIGR01987 family)|nr:nucleotidyltransferase substrate binding protein [Planctomycetaceae bacterium]